MNRGSSPWHAVRVGETIGAQLKIVAAYEGCSVRQLVDEVLGKFLVEWSERKGIALPESEQAAAKPTTDGG